MTINFHRPICDAPLEPGWFYARAVWDKTAQPYPIQVVREMGHGLMVKSYMGKSSMLAWSFFGPVPQCIEVQA